MIRKKVLSSMAIILVLLTSTPSFCSFSELVNSTKQKTKKALENITVKDVVTYSAGITLLGISIFLVKQNIDMQLRLDKLTLRDPAERSFALKISRFIGGLVKKLKKSNGVKNNGFSDL